MAAVEEPIPAGYDPDELPPTEVEKREARDRAVESENSATAAANLKIAGANWPEIAQVLGYSSPGAARAAAERAMAKMYDPETDYAAMRQLASARYERVLRSLSRKALNEKLDVPDPRKPGATKRVENHEHLAYASLFTKVVGEIANLHGLKAPQVLQIQSPTDEEFAGTVHRLMELAGSLPAQEADILELEATADGTFEEVADAEDDE